ncbi:MAG: hypothetical protein IKP02_09430 [Paludibacteraceae bacterium]|nr:hypothetical protein [Paludibacteraceae bacterium]
MKKSLILAFALAASTLAFVACNDKKDKEVSEDQEQTAMDIKALIGSRWRIDSISIGGVPQPNRMSDVFKLVSESSFIRLDNKEDLIPISVKDKKATVGENFWGHEMTFDIIEATQEFIRLSSTTSVDNDGDGIPEKEAPLKITIGRIPDSNGEKVELTKEAIIGQWKADYYWEFGTYTSGGTWDRLLVSYNFHGLDMWTFNADGTCTMVNLFDKAVSTEKYEPQTGFWKIEGGYLYVRMDEKASFENRDICDFEQLTTNVAIFKTYFNTTTTYHYFHKVK